MQKIVNVSQLSRNNDVNLIKFMIIILIEEFGFKIRHFEFFSCSFTETSELHEPVAVENAESSQLDGQILIT